MVWLEIHDSSVAHGMMCCDCAMDALGYEQRAIGTAQAEYCPVCGVGLPEMVFATRHTPTRAQIALAIKAGYYLIAAGDIDAFDEEAFSALTAAHPGAVAVACVHPLVGLRAHMAGLSVGVYKNANRAPEGAKPSFEAVGLTICCPDFCVDYSL